MPNLRKTLFLYDMQESSHPKFAYQAPYIFYDRNPPCKWRQATWYFNSVEEVTTAARARGYVVKTQRPTAYQQMKREAARTGLPRAFQTDLTVHDRNFLRRRKRPRQFGWVLRECGTELLLNTTWARVQLQYYGRQPDVYWYWFDGETLRASTPDEIRELLVQQPEVTRETYPTLFVS